MTWTSTHHSAPVFPPISNSPSSTSSPYHLASTTSTWHTSPLFNLPLSSLIDFIDHNQLFQYSPIAIAAGNIEVQVNFQVSTYLPLRLRTYQQPYQKLTILFRTQRDHGVRDKGREVGLTWVNGREPLQGELPRLARTLLLTHFTVPNATTSEANRHVNDEHRSAETSAFRHESGPGDGRCTTVSLRYAIVSNQ